MRSSCLEIEKNPSIHIHYFQVFTCMWFNSFLRLHFALKTKNILLISDLAATSINIYFFNQKERKFNRAI